MQSLVRHSYPKLPRACRWQCRSRLTPQRTVRPHILVVTVAWKTRNMPDSHKVRKFGSRSDRLTLTCSLLVSKINPTSHVSIFWFPRSPPAARARDGGLDDSDKAVAYCDFLDDSESDGEALAVPP